MILCSLLEHGFTLLHVRDELVGSELGGREAVGAVAAGRPVRRRIAAEAPQVTGAKPRRKGTTGMPSSK